jgi:hypothetical protein
MPVVGGYPSDYAALIGATSSYKIIKAATANAAGVGAFRWKPRNAQRTENGLIQVCAVPSKGAAEVCSAATSITVQ